MNVFEQLKIAITDVKRYGLLLELKTGKFILYFMLLVLINVVGVSATILPSYIKSGGISNIVENMVPDFSVENGKLKMEKVDFTDDAQSACIYIDTSRAELEMAKGRGYQTVFIGSSDEIYISNGINETIIKVSDFDGVDKADVVKLVSDKSFLTGMTIGFFISIFVFFIMVLLVQGAFEACIVNLCNAISIRARVSFWKIFRICIYAFTLPMILNILFIFFGITVFQLFSNIIAFAYIYYALKEIKKGDGIVVAVLDE